MYLCVVFTGPQICTGLIGVEGGREAVENTQIKDKIHNKSFLVLFKVRTEALNQCLFVFPMHVR